MKARLRAEAAADTLPRTLWTGSTGTTFVASALREWESVWEAPGLASSVRVAFSSRLRRSLGRASPATGRVVLHTKLRDAPRPRLLEVLCHEVAHIAVARRAHLGQNLRPSAHGPEWAALVRVAGFTPTARAPLSPDLHVAPSSSRGTRGPVHSAHKGQYPVVHTCPVCHSQRHARRAVPSWRCADCVAAGLEGVLVISRAGSGMP